MPLDELTKEFSLEGIGRTNAIFNFQEHDSRHWTDDKALWMNAEYIRTMAVEDLLPMVKAELRNKQTPGVMSMRTQIAPGLSGLLI